MVQEHPFAQYVRILARGPGRSRALTFDEARDAMRMIAAGEAEPIQLGAMLMLMRYRQESPEELAGFVAALRETFPPSSATQVDLDWPSYAAGRIARGALVFACGRVAGAKRCARADARAREIARGADRRAARHRRERHGAGGGRAARSGEFRVPAAGEGRARGAEPSSICGLSSACARLRILSRAF